MGGAPARARGRFRGELQYHEDISVDPVSFFTKPQPDTGFDLRQDLTRARATVPLLR
jgi:hypothetical protein